MTNAHKAAILDHYYGGGDLSRPATIWIGLSTTTPTDTGANFTEPIGNGYVRLELANNTDTWNDATADDPSEKTNKIEFTFAEASGAWGTITHWGLFTQEEDGICVEWAELQDSKVIGNGDTPRFKVGEFKSILQNAAGE